MNDRILVPYDGSELAEDALEFAFERFPDAEVTALYVIQIPEPDVFGFEGPELRPPVTEKATEYGNDLLEDAVAVASAHGREIDTEVDRGKPDHRIVAHASEDAYDLIVIGSHGREGLSEALLGSVAERVVRRSPIPVVVVR